MKPANGPTIRVATSRAIVLTLLLSLSWTGGPMPAMAAGAAMQPGSDGRLREVIYDPQAVVTVPAKRGIVTLVVLETDETITELASGHGGDCSKPEAAWCIAAQPGGRTVFVKPKRSAATANNLAIVTSQRIHNLRFQVLADDDPRLPLYRLVIRAPLPATSLTTSLTPRNGHAGSALDAQAHATAQTEPQAPAPSSLQPQVQAPLQALLPPLPSPEQLVAERMQAKPSVLNTRYSLAEGADSQDIVPTLVFDDGRFTYLRLPGNREVPAVFQILGDGSEALVNARMEDELLVIDRVSRRLMLRAGSAVVGLWNDAFDIEGVPSDHGTTVPGVRRALRATGAAPVLLDARSTSVPAGLPRLRPDPHSKDAAGDGVAPSADPLPTHGQPGGVP